MIGNLHSAKMSSRMPDSKAVAGQAAQLANLRIGENIKHQKQVSKAMPHAVMLSLPKGVQPIQRRSVHMEYLDLKQVMTFDVTAGKPARKSQGSARGVYVPILEKQVFQTNRADADSPHTKSHRRVSSSRSHSKLSKDGSKKPRHSNLEDKLPPVSASSMSKPSSISNRADLRGLMRIDDSFKASVDDSDFDQCSLMLSPANANHRRMA